MHPIRRIVLSLGAGLLIASGTAAAFDLGRLVDSVKSVGKASEGFSEEQEVRIGGDMAALLLGAAPLVEDEAVQRYVNELGLWIALQSDRSGLPWRFGVLSSDNLNAFAAPGGYVFITRGLFLNLNDEAELAAVLAHEIGHVLARHHLEAARKAAQTDAALDLVGMAVSDNDQQTLDLLAEVGKSLYTRGLERGDELEADRMGVVLAARAGYDPYALQSVLTTIDSISPDDPGVALFLSTHPPAKERLLELDRGMDARFEPYAGRGGEGGRFPEMRRRLAATVATP